MIRASGALSVVQVSARLSPQDSYFDCGKASSI